MKIAVAGIGYVGLSNAVLLAQNHDVTMVDISQKRVEIINARQCPIVDPELEDFLANKDLSLPATIEVSAYRDADFIIVATPTNYDPKFNVFDISSVEKVIGEAIAVNKSATIIIKSTVPVGYTQSLSEELKNRPSHLRPGVLARRQSALRQSPPVADHRR